MKSIVAKCLACRVSIAKPSHHLGSWRTLSSASRCPASIVGRKSIAIRRCSDSLQDCTRTQGVPTGTDCGKVATSNVLTLAYKAYRGCGVVNVLQDEVGTFHLVDAGVVSLASPYQISGPDCPTCLTSGTCLTINSRRFLQRKTWGKNEGKDTRISTPRRTPVITWFLEDFTNSTICEETCSMLNVSAICQSLPRHFKDTETDIVTRGGLASILPPLSALSSYMFCRVK